MDFDKNIAIIKQGKIGSKPIIFDLSKSTDREKVQQLFDLKKIQHISDDFEEQHLELYGIRNPSRVYTPGFKEEFSDYYKKLSGEKPLEQHGVWIYYPWLFKLVHTLAEEDFFIVRTARNRNLINSDEQKTFYNAKIGIGGLSVGSSVAFALTLQGGPRHIKLADMDRLALTNTNRVLSGIDNLGMLKVEMAARFMYQINPYMNIELYPNGLNKENIDEFCADLDLVVDELDNISIKYLIREQARKYKIPVVMGADNGDNAVVDIERYDLDPMTPYFHDRIPGATYESLSNLDKFGIGKTITQHIGPENITERMQESLLAMGKSIVSWPQLGGAALINGAAVAYCIRKILNGQPLEGNRALIVLDEKLIPNYNSSSEQEKRDRIANEFRKMFGL
jgi:tRNA threonylcarbamoyladenosine dehydratase